MRSQQLIKNNGDADSNITMIEDAIYDFNEAIAIKEGNKEKYTEAYCFRGLAKAFLKQFGDAASDIDKAVTINSTCPETFYCRGLIAALQKDYDTAIENYKKALDLNISLRHYVLCESAYSYLDLSKNEEALEYYEEALKINPISDIAKEGIRHTKKEIDKSS